MEPTLGKKKNQISVGTWFLVADQCFWYLRNQNPQTKSEKSTKEQRNYPDP